jgi:hypothetical protein
LKGRLRKYETPKVPSDLKNDRLFEVKFFDGMPRYVPLSIKEIELFPDLNEKNSDKRSEIEAFLALYVQGLAALPVPAPVASTSTSPAPTPLVIPSPSRFSSVVNLVIPPFVPRIRTPSTVAPASQEASISSSVPSATPNLEPTRRKTTIRSKPSTKDPNRKSKRNLTDREILAAPSYSGHEPVSLSGTGVGMRIKALPKAKRSSAPSSSKTRSESTSDAKKAVEIVAALEKLFSDSIFRESGGRDSRGTSNDSEAYLGVLLGNDDNLEGWTYLILAFNFGQLHRYSVTLDTVSQAIQDHSTKLQLSADKTMVRWIGAKPEEKSLKSQNSESGRKELDNESTKSLGSSAGSASALLSARATSTVATSIEGLSKKPLSYQPHRHSRHHRIGTHTPDIELSLSVPPALPAEIVRLPIVRSSHSNYTPFFDRKDESILDSLDSLSEAQSDEVKKKNSDDQGQVIIFYANQPFCSDLSKDIETMNVCQEGTLVDVESNMVVDNKDQSKLPRGEVEEVEVDDEEMEEEIDDSIIKIYNGHHSTFHHNISHLSTPIHQMTVSGMNEVVSRDCFTLTVETLHYKASSNSLLPPPVVTTPSKKRKHSLTPPTNSIATKAATTTSTIAEGSELKRMKLDGGFSHRVITSKVHHHRIQLLSRREGETEDYDSGEESSDNEGSNSSIKQDELIPDIVRSSLSFHFTLAGILMRGLSHFVRL